MKLFATLTCMLLATGIGYAQNYAESPTPTAWTAITTVNANTPMSATPGVVVTAPSTGTYLLLGRGTMGAGTPTTSALCSLSLHNNTTSQQVFKGVGFSAKNNTGSSLIQHIVQLNANDVIELKYASDITDPVKVGHPGDNIILVKVDAKAESSTPASFTNISTVNAGTPMSATPGVVVTVPSTGTYLMLGRGTMGAGTTTTSALCSLSLHNNTTSQQIFAGVGFSAKNNTSSSLLLHTAQLNANDVIELKYTSDITDPVTVGHPGDNIILVKVDTKAESSTPTGPTNITTVNAGTAMSANPGIVVTVPSTGKYLIMGRGTMGVGTASSALCTLSLHNNTTSQKLFEGTGFSSANNTKSSVIQHIANLNAGDVIELKYASDLTDPVAVGYHGDNIVLVKIDPPLSITEAKTASFNVNVSPNPFSNHLVVTYTLTNGGETSIEMFGVDGRLVLKTPLARKATGTFEESFDLADSRIAPGVYVLKLTVGEYAIEKQIICIK